MEEGWGIRSIRIENIVEKFIPAHAKVSVILDSNAEYYAPFFFSFR
jgi:hypothetical protein